MQSDAKPIAACPFSVLFHLYCRDERYSCNKTQRCCGVRGIEHRSHPSFISSNRMTFWFLRVIVSSIISFLYNALMTFYHQKQLRVPFYPLIDV